MNKLVSHCESPNEIFRNVYFPHYFQVSFQMPKKVHPEKLQDPHQHIAQVSGTIYLVLIIL